MHKFQTTIFNHLLGCLKANFRLLNWQILNLSYLMLIIELYAIRSKGHWEPCDKVGYQSPADHIIRFRTRNFRIWSWSANPLCIYPLTLVNSEKKSQCIQEILLEMGYLEKELSKICKFNLDFYGNSYEKQSVRS